MKIAHSCLLALGVMLAAGCSSGGGGGGLAPKASPAASGSSLEVTEATPDQIRAIGITTLVGKEIVVDAPLIWEVGLTGGIPEMEPDPVERVTPMTWSYPEGDQYVLPDWRGHGMPNVGMTGTGIAVVEVNGKEWYRFNGVPLESGKQYRIRGVLRYREWLGVGATHLADPEFIAQSNNPAYWSQTFEFVVTAIEPSAAG